MFVLFLPFLPSTPHGSNLIFISRPIFLFYLSLGLSIFLPFSSLHLISSLYLSLSSCHYHTSTIIAACRRSYSHSYPTTPRTYMYTANSAIHHACFPHESCCYKNPQPRSDCVFSLPHFITVFIVIIVYQHRQQLQQRSLHSASTHVPTTAALFLNRRGRRG